MIDGFFFNRGNHEGRDEAIGFRNKLSPVVFSCLAVSSFAFPDCTSSLADTAANCISFECVIKYGFNHNSYRDQAVITLMGSLPFCVGNWMTRIHGKDIAPFRFLTPFPHRPPRRLRNSELKACHFQPDERTQSFFIRLILSCSNILGGRFHRLPSWDDSRRLNLQGRFFHSRVFYPHYLKENFLI